MGAKKEIRAKDVLRDIRSGLSNEDLMEKHHLSPAGLRSLFRKLADARIIRKEELEARIPALPPEEAQKDRRRSQRCYPVTSFPIYDLDDLRQEWQVLDIGEDGLKVSGIKARLGQRKDFLIQADEFGDVFPFTFQAECRWSKLQEDGVPIAGFEIITMPEKGAQELKKLLKAVMFCT